MASPGTSTLRSTACSTSSCSPSTEGQIFREPRRCTKKTTTQSTTGTSASQTTRAGSLRLTRSAGRRAGQKSFIRCLRRGTSGCKLIPPPSRHRLSGRRSGTSETCSKTSIINLKSMKTSRIKSTVTTARFRRASQRDPSITNWEVLATSEIKQASICRSSAKAAQS